MKFDPEVKKEIKFMALGCALCSAAVMLVFVIIGKFDLSVLFGALVGYVLAVGNFILMSYGVVKALETGDEASAKLKMRSSYIWRTIVMLAVMALAIAFEAVHWVPVVVSVFYPRILITARGIFNNIRARKNPPPDYEPLPDDNDEEKTDEFEKFVSGFSKGSVPGVKEENKPDENKPVDKSDKNDGSNGDSGEKQ
ncbi:MAG: ATP synthase subunit I [Eubacteriales bacterium]